LPRQFVGEVYATVRQHYFVGQCFHHDVARCDLRADDYSLIRRVDQIAIEEIGVVLGDSSG
jgi:hypothetical protein